MSKNGKTTRLIDRLVQDFFESGFCYVYETRNDSIEVLNDLLKRFSDRMFYEHRDAKFSSSLVKQDGIRCYKVEKHDL